MRLPLLLAGARAPDCDDIRSPPLWQPARAYVCVALPPAGERRACAGLPAGVVRSQRLAAGGDAFALEDSALRGRPLDQSIEL